MKNWHHTIAAIIALTVSLYGCSSTDSPLPPTTDSVSTTTTITGESPADSPVIVPNNTRDPIGLWQDAEVTDSFFHILEDGNAIDWELHYLAEFGGPNCYNAFRFTWMSIGNNQYQLVLHEGEGADVGAAGVVRITVEGSIMTVTTSETTSQYIRRDDLDPNFPECPPGQ